MKLDIKEILRLMPHRYPIPAGGSGARTRARRAHFAPSRTSPLNEPFFQGHFPGHPVMPGVLIIEALAQAAAVLTYVTMKTSYPEGTLFLFAGIDGARFKRPVEPGDQLRLEVTMDRIKRGIGKFTCRRCVDDELVCESAN